MMTRVLQWLQDRVWFVHSDAYPDYDRRMDAYLKRATGPAPPAERENWMSEVLKERGPSPRKERPR